jgi:hypothetical protein
MGIEENHDLTLVAAGRVLGCFLGRVFGHWNSRGDFARRPSFLCSLVFADTLTERKKYERFNENRTAASFLL